MTWALKAEVNTNLEGSALSSLDFSNATLFTGVEEGDLVTYYFYVAATYVDPWPAPPVTPGLDETDTDTLIFADSYQVAALAGTGWRRNVLPQYWDSGVLYAGSFVCSGAEDNTGDWSFGVVPGSAGAVFGVGSMKRWRASRRTASTNYAGAVGLDDPASFVSPVSSYPSLPWSYSHSNDPRTGLNSDRGIALIQLIAVAYPGVSTSDNSLLLSNYAFGFSAELNPVAVELDHDELSDGNGSDQTYTVASYFYELSSSDSASYDFSITDSIGVEENFRAQVATVALGEAYISERDPNPRQSLRPRRFRTHQLPHDIRRVR